MGVKLQGGVLQGVVETPSPARFEVTTYDTIVTSGQAVVSDFQEFTITPYTGIVANAESLPSGWFSADIGVSDPEGSASESSGTYTLSGGGPNPTNTEDGGHFAYQVVNSSVVTITGRVTVPTGSEWSQVGLMVRDSLSSGAKRITLFVTPGDTAGHKFSRWRTDNDVADSNTGVRNNVSGQLWLRIEIDSSIKTYQSTDGVVFDEIFAGSDKSITFDDTTLLVGLYASNADEGTSQSGTIDNVTITTPTLNDVVSDFQEFTVTPYTGEVLPNNPPDENIIYVATNGDDSNDGSIQSPVATLDRAMDLAGSDQILVRDGEYTEAVTLRDNVKIDGYPGEQAVFRTRWEGNIADGWTIGTRVKFYGGDGTTGSPDNKYGTRTISGVLPNLGRLWTFKAQIENTDGWSGLELDDDSAFGCEVSDVVIHRHGTPFDGIDGSFGDCFDFSEGGPKDITQFKIHDCFVKKTGHNGIELLGNQHFLWRYVADNDWTDEYTGLGHRALGIVANAQRLHCWDFLIRGVRAAGETETSKEAKFFAANSAFYNFYLLSDAHVKCAISAGVRSDPPVIDGLRFAHAVIANGRSGAVQARGWDNTAGLVWRDIQFKNCIFWNNRTDPFESGDVWDIDIYVNINPFGGVAEFGEFQVKGCAFGPTTPKFRFVGFPGVTNNAEELSYWETNYPDQFSDNQIITSDPFVDSTAGFAGTIEDAQTNGAASAVSNALNDAAAGFTSTSTQIVNAGVDLTTTNGDGENTTVVPVNDIKWFREFRTDVPLQRVKIGDNPVSEVIESGFGGITVSAPVTFSNGDSVNYEYNGTAPNIGPVQ